MCVLRCKNKKTDTYKSRWSLRSEALDLGFSHFKVVHVAYSVSVDRHLWRYWMCQSSVRISAHLKMLIWWKCSWQSWISLEQRLSAVSCDLSLLWFPAISAFLQTWSPILLNSLALSDEPLNILPCLSKSCLFSHFATEICYVQKKQKDPISTKTGIARQQL